MPASLASSTTYWINGLSTMVSISFGIALVAGRTRVPRPATGKTALRIFMGQGLLARKRTSRPFVTGFSEIEKLGVVLASPRSARGEVGLRSNPGEGRGTELEQQRSS